MIGSSYDALDLPPLITPEQSESDRLAFIELGKRRRKAKVYSKERRNEIIRSLVPVVKADEIAVNALAAEYEVSENTIRAWVRKAEWLIEVGGL